MTCVFISYRRDDAAGFAGRLEDAIQRAFGQHSAFRDVDGIAAGEDFVTAINRRLADADAVLVLIGPRWAGPLAEGGRRIDDSGDFVRLEVATALASGRRVIPVLLPGGCMPAEKDLPEPLKPLAHRNAVVLSDAAWTDDVARLITTLGSGAMQRRRYMRTGAALLAVVLAIGAVVFYRQWQANEQAAQHAAEQAAAVNAMLGTWRATGVKYEWGDKYDEVFIFKSHAGEVTGTASFLGYPRGIEALKIEGADIHFITRTVQSISRAEPVPSDTDMQRELTHHYSAERKGDVLLFRLLSTGGYTSSQPLEFEAHRVTAP